MLGAAVVAALLALSAGNAAASTLTVNTTADETVAGDGQCSLREAVQAVDAPGSAGGDCAPAAFGPNTIVLGPHMYTLNGPSELEVTGNVSSLTIRGAGAGPTVVHASGLRDRVFQVDAQARATIRDLTITGGHARDGNNSSQGFGPGETIAGQNGGGVLNQGSLTLIDAGVTHNQAGTGGIADGQFAANSGDGGWGGGIFNTGALVVIGSTIAGNLAGNGGDGTGGGVFPPTLQAIPGGRGGAGGDGGGIGNVGGTVSVSDSTIEGNVAGHGAPGGWGGGQPDTTSGANAGAGGNGGSGGGISTRGGTLSIVNSTVALNAAGGGGDGGRGGTGSSSGGNGGNGGNGGDGGGMAVARGATAALRSVTTVGNRAAGGGAGGGPGGPSTSMGVAGKPGAAGVTGGVFSGGARTTLRDSLVAQNAGGNCASVADGGHNLSFRGGGCPRSFISRDPKLRPLHDNGGPTLSMSLQRGSAAIDRIPVRDAGCPATDQRGVRRPGGRACDIGAYEVAPPRAALVAAHAIGTHAVRIVVSARANAGHGRVWVLYGRTSAYGRRSVAKGIRGRGPTTVSIVLRGLDLNATYHYRVMVSSMDGSSRSADIALAVPVLASLAVTPRSFGVGGTTLTFTDTRQALTTFTVQERAGNRWVTLGAFRHRDVPGTNRVYWNGRLHGRKLGRGSYRLEASPRLGRSTGETVRAKFTVVA
jgi:CSLREA domain-containing protein